MAEQGRTLLVCFRLRALAAHSKRYARTRGGNQSLLNVNSAGVGMAHQVRGNLVHLGMSSWKKAVQSSLGRLLVNSTIESRHHLAPRVFRALPSQRSCVQMFLGTYWMPGMGDKRMQTSLYARSSQLKRVDTRGNQQLGYSVESPR